MADNAFRDFPLHRHANAMPALAHAQFSFRCKNGQGFEATYSPLFVIKVQKAPSLLSSIRLHGLVLN